MAEGLMRPDLRRGRTPESAGENATVLIHHDGLTPRAYAILVLQTIFQLSDELAEHITIVADTMGIARVVTRPRREAERLMHKAHTAARLTGFPLTFSLKDPRTSWESSIASSRAATEPSSWIDQPTRPPAPSHIAREHVWATGGPVGSGPHHRNVGFRSQSVSPQKLQKKNVRKTAIAFALVSILLLAAVGLSIADGAGDTTSKDITPLPELEATGESVNSSPTPLATPPTVTTLDYGLIGDLDT